MSTSRRSFLATLAKAAGVFTILPPATTYSRIWRATRPPIDLAYTCTMRPDVNHFYFVDEAEFYYRKNADGTFETLFYNARNPDHLQPCTTHLLETSSAKSCLE